MTVRTRFAPSPTGFLHLGSARTALFNWAYARHQQGTFVLRIEDTDRQRSTLESERAVLEGLEWLGIDFDEGPFRQSERADRHREAIDRMLAADRAYRCQCSADDLQQRKEATIARGDKWTYDGRCRDLGLGPDCGPHVVRLRMPESGTLGWDDRVFGSSGQDVSELGDAIVRKSDGQPLYNLAVVVDDLDMEISHVIRGADHHINTAVQIAIYRALDREPPIFAHVPLIVGDGGKKLSKRRDSVSIQDFREQGYLPEALVNWLIRLGWSHGDDEIFSAEQIRTLFDLDAVNRSSAQADLAKLQWLNQHYLKELPEDDLWQALAPFLERETGGPVSSPSARGALLGAVRERGKTLAEMAGKARFAFVDEVELDEKAATKHLKPTALPLLEDLRRRLGELGDWSEAGLEATFDAVRADHGDVGMGKLAQPVRVAVTGGTVSPGIFETLIVLGPERTLARLDAALDWTRARTA